MEVGLEENLNQAQYNTEMPAYLNATHGNFSFVSGVANNRISVHSPRQWPRYSLQQWQQANLVLERDQLVVSVDSSTPKDQPYHGHNSPKSETSKPNSQTEELPILNGKPSHPSIPPWRPSGSFKVIANLASITADPSKKTMLLSSSNSTNYLGFSHNSALGQWGDKYPGIWGRFNFDQTKYVEFTVEEKRMTVSDGIESAVVKNQAIDPTSISYDWLYRRGGGFSEGALSSLQLIDIDNPHNSRNYQFRQPHSPDRPDSVALPQNKPDNTKAYPRLGPQLVGSNSRALALNGTGAHMQFSPWSPNGEHRIVAWIQEVSDSPLYLVSHGVNSSFLAITDDSFIGNFYGNQIVIEKKFRFNETKFVEIVVSKTHVAVSDGHAQYDLYHNAVAPQTYDNAFRYKGEYSQGIIQAIALIDIDSSDPVRSYTFDKKREIIVRSKSPAAYAKLINVGSRDWLAINSGVTTPINLIKHQADWDAYFENSYRHQRPLLDVTHGNDHGEFAWHGHYWLRAYLTMAKTYDDEKYLDYAVELIDHIFKYNDRERQARGEINLTQQPYKVAPKALLNDGNKASLGWRRPMDGFRVAVISDGQVLNAVMRIVDHIKANNIQRYMAKADDYLAKSKAIIDAHGSSFSHTKNSEIAGSYFYVNDKNRAYGNRGLYSNPLPFNHSMTMAVAMIYVHKWTYNSTDMRNKIRDIILFFEDNLIYQPDGSCSWNYAYDVNGNTKVEDTNHAHIDIGFLLVAEQEGYIDDRALNCMAATFTNKVFIAPGLLSHDVEGRGVGDRWVQVASVYDWADLAAWDPRIIEMNQHLLRHFGAPNWSRTFLGWATMLYWQQLTATDGN